MENLNSLTNEDLVDLLSTQTALYIRMHSEGAATQEEFSRCLLFLNAIQKEINSRNKKTTSSPYFSNQGT